MGFSTDESSGGGGAPTGAQYWVGAADATLSDEKNLGAFSGIVKNTTGVPSAANPALDYVAPGATASTASATTVTLPETGFLVPITGTTTIDFLTKPTGDAPRVALLWFQSALSVRSDVGGAGAGATNIASLPGGSASLDQFFAANSFMLVAYDGAQWRRIPSMAHWNGSQKAVMGDSDNAMVHLSNSTGAQLRWANANQSVTADSSGITITGATTLLSTRPKLNKASVASASNVTLTAGAPLIDITGTTTINTFTATGWTDGMIVWLRFAGVLTITNNSGGTNDFVSRDGIANITTSAGMVLPFMFDGTDMREIGR